MSAAKTNAELQAAFRARKAEQGTPEVRGIFAHAADMPAIKAFALDLKTKRAATAPA